jgi:hypothetical protein
MGVSFATLPAPTSAIKVTPSTQDVISKVLAKHKNQKAPVESKNEVDLEEAEDEVIERTENYKIVSGFKSFTFMPLKYKW